mmetsp:Transcript_34716/g.110348  ORF Transcript_34716/g.110348 Transcript_34716/m.110348 type:complete len:211 (-) Transcript_34716:1429-2061(-)
MELTASYRARGQKAQSELPLQHNTYSRSNNASVLDRSVARENTTAESIHSRGLGLGSGALLAPVLDRSVARDHIPAENSRGRGLRLGSRQSQWLLILELEAEPLPSAGVDHVDEVAQVLDLLPIELRHSLICCSGQPLGQLISEHLDKHNDLVPVKLAPRICHPGRCKPCRSHNLVAPAEAMLQERLGEHREHKSTDAEVLRRLWRIHRD